MEQKIRNFLEELNLNELLLEAVQDLQYDWIEILLQEDANPNYTNTFEGSPLDNLYFGSKVKIQIAILERLLEAGASPNFRLASRINSNGCFLNRIENPDSRFVTISDQQKERIKQLLVKHSAMPVSEIKANTPLPTTIRGTKNPQKITAPYYYYVMSKGYNADRIRQQTQFEPIKRRKVPKTYLFRATEKYYPLWNYHIFGTSSTLLADGSVVHIGGEHEDWYDEDFCIFNDVVKIDAAGNAQIYFYPTTTFPPTDFHTATLYQNQIIIIGGLGYTNQRQMEETPVFALNLDNFSIQTWQTKGQKPGWIYKHIALADFEQDRILVFGGIKKEETQASDEVFAFYPKEKRWTYLGNYKGLIKEIEQITN